MVGEIKNGAIAKSRQPVCNGGRPIFRSWRVFVVPTIFLSKLHIEPSVVLLENKLYAKDNFKSFPAILNGAWKRLAIPIFCFPGSLFCSNL
jgi:hypothetical protein